ncbi:hypothetical protein ACFPRA_23560 [Sporosarcina soli]|uniref:RsgI N-terminal anti-sigma domain-containing protein n=1 Tax=Sporosarcina soli TaxID=334736 RepID=A0ABW0TSQ7_9BACL
MRTYRGVVCERKNKYTVFLTEKGNFLRGIPIGGSPDIGEEVDFHPVFTPPLFAGKVKPQFAGAVLIAAVLLLFIVASLIPINDKVMAYVQLEAGIALELGINQAGKVITLRYLNDASDEQEDKLTNWKGRTFSQVLDTAVKKLVIETSDVPVILTTIFTSSEKQHKVERIVGSAVQEVRGAHKELAWEISGSTLEERVLANQHDMSIHKFKASQQGPPVDEKKPSTKIEHDEKTNSRNQPRDQEVPQQSVPTTLSNQKNNGNENQKEPKELQEPKLKKSDPKPNKGQEERFKSSPTEKEKPSHPTPDLKNANKGNQSPTVKQSKEDHNQQKQPETGNSHGSPERPPVGNGRE